MRVDILLIDVAIIISAKSQVRDFHRRNSDLLTMAPSCIIARVARLSSINGRFFRPCSLDTICRRAHANLARARRLAAAMIGFRLAFASPVPSIFIAGVARGRLPRCRIARADHEEMSVMMLSCAEIDDSLRSIKPSAPTTAPPAVRRPAPQGRHDAEDAASAYCFYRHEI